VLLFIKIEFAKYCGPLINYFELRDIAALLASASAATNSARQVASLGSGNTTRLRSNINELDNLLDDLNSPQRLANQGYSSRKEGSAQPLQK